MSEKKEGSYLPKDLKPTETSTPYLPDTKTEEPSVKITNMPAVNLDLEIRSKALNAAAHVCNGSMYMVPTPLEVVRHAKEYELYLRGGS